MCNNQWFPLLLSVAFQAGILQRAFSKEAKLVCFPRVLLYNVLYWNKVPFQLKRYSELL